MTAESPSSRAQMITTSANEALPIQRLSPLSTQLSPSRRALVSSATESEPCRGSVSANAPTLSSRAIAGSQRCFCSSLPSIAMVPMARPEWTPRNVLMLPSPRATSRRDQAGGEAAHAGAAVALDACSR